MDEQSPEEIERAKVYNRLKHWLTLANFLYTLFYLAVVLFAGISSSLAARATDWAGPGVGGKVVYLVGFIILATVATLPIDFYSSYTIEHRFNLSNQTAAGGLADQGKGLGLSIVIATPVVLVAYLLLAQVPTSW